MEREILFRGKRFDNGEWVEGYYLCQKNNYIGTKHYIYVFGDKEYNEYCNEDSRYEVVHITVGQYTGLQDKNGDKIFEGDIVKVPMYRTYTVVPNFMKGTIEWKNGAFHVIWDDDMYGRHFLGYLEDVEVIGNIFDDRKGND